MNGVAIHPALEPLNADQRAALMARSPRMTLAPGERVFAPGQRCEGLPLVVDGEIRVQMIGASGNEIVLYRIAAGELCTLSVSCLLADAAYRAEAIVETGASVLVVPAAVFDTLMAEAPGFRAAVLRSYGERLQTLMLVVEEVAFGRLDQRLADHLISRQSQGVLATTHQALAVELGTAREVISRLLKQFERQQLVHLERGLVELRDERGLARIAAGMGS